MVIFEYLEKNPHITDITLFTFQYGDIQIKDTASYFGINIEFTFQFGDIKIFFLLSFSPFNFIIYIPIW